MKTVLILLVSIFSLFSFTPSSFALPITDFHDAGHMYMSQRHNHRVSWTFDLTEHGFDPLSQDVMSAEIILDLQDDNRDRNERAVLRMGENRFRWEVDSGEFTISLESLVVLSDTGIVNCTLIVREGDFFFNGAMLRAESNVPVPEPSTIFLLGTGLLSFGVYMRKSLRN